MAVFSTALRQGLIAMLAVLAVSSWTLAAHAQAVDPMAPTSSAADAITSPLAAVSVATGDLETARRFYQGVLGLAPREETLTGPAARRLARHWGLGPTDRLSVTVFSNPYAPGSAMVRVVAVPADTPTGRPDVSSRYIGPLGFGMPMINIEQRKAIVSAFGFESTAGVVSMNFPRADKTTYKVSEIHFRAPDDMLVLGVDRGEQTQIGPIDPALSMGGVAYASFLVEDLETSGAFFRDVLGFELRREMSFRASGPGGGMQDMRAQEVVAFLHWFSPGARTGYLVMMKLLDGGRLERRSNGFATRGIAAWSFKTRDLNTVVRRWRAHSGKTAAIYAGELPGFGRVRAVMLRTPDGMPVEVVERTKP